MVALMKSDNQIAQPQAKSNEWYTPARYIEAAREVMGSIDLDPASCFEANQTVRAKHYYTVRDDGLAQAWYGRVWLNPPFSQANRDNCGLYKSTLETFALKLIEEYERGNVTQAVFLGVAKVNSLWFTHMWQYPICFPNHTVAFQGEKTNPKNTLKHLWGTIFVYLGPNEQKFINIFSQFGTIAKRVSPPKSAPSTLWEVTL